MRQLLYPILFLLSTLPVVAQISSPVAILSERDRARAVDEILEDRFANFLPQLMRREGIDMWVIISREYNEDPVLKTMLPSTWLSARRRTIMVFYDNGKEGADALEKLAIARYDVGNLLKGAWDIDVRPNQWDALAKIIEDRKPKKIGLNFSTNYAHADGLAFTEHEEFLQKLPAEYQKTHRFGGENWPLAGSKPVRRKRWRFIRSSADCRTKLFRKGFRSRLSSRA